MTAESAPEQHFPDSGTLIAQLDASLRESGEISAAEREAMVRQFRETLEGATPAEGTHGDPLFANWAAALCLLREHQLMSDEDVLHLERQFAAVAEKLADDRVRLANAYLDRIESGDSDESEARVWLAEASRGTSGSAQDAAAAASALGLVGTPRADQRQRRRT